MSKKKISLTAVFITFLLAAMFVPHLFQGRKHKLPAIQSKETSSEIRRATKIDTFFNDNFGNDPVLSSFDSDPGEICGNGKSQYYRSKPPKKPIPKSWVAPPRVGSDPSYQGPDPLSPIKESPYAMPAARKVFRRTAPSIKEDATFAASLSDLQKSGSVTIRYASTSNIPKWLNSAAPNLQTTSIITDETSNPENAFQKLKAQGVTHIVIDQTTPPPAPWIETNYTSLPLRLRDHLPTGYFQAKIIGRNYTVYAVQKTPTLGQREKQLLTQYIRNNIKRKKTSYPGINSTVPPVDGNSVRVVISLRGRSIPALKGRKISRRIGRGTTLQKAIQHSLSRLKEGWSKTRASVRSLYKYELPESLDSAIASLELDVEIFSTMAQVTDRSTRRLSNHMELGIDGLYIRTADQFYYLEPSYALHRSRTSPYRFLLRLIERSKLKQFLSNAGSSKNAIGSSWFDNTSTRFGSFQTIHWVENTPGGDIVPLYRGFPFVAIKDLSSKAVASAAHAGADWLVTHQDSDGQYGYKYEPFAKESKRWTPGGNIVRHALNSYTLLMVQAASPDPRFIESAKNGIRFTLRFLRKDGKRCVICHRDVPAPYYNAKIGASAVTILSILKLAEFEDISEFSSALDCLAEEILFMQDPNGHFRQYDVPPDHPYFGAESSIPPGQLLMVLARLYQHTKDKRFLTAASRSLPYYLKAWRHMVAQATDDGVYVDEDRANIVGIIPWMIMALNDLHTIEPKPEYVSAAFEMQDWMLAHLFYSEERSPYGDYLGAGFKSQSELPAINACQFTEGATALHNLAKRAGIRQNETRKNALLGVRFCMQLQFRDDQSTFFLPDQKVALGGFRYHLGVTRLRNDYSYHALASLSQALAYIPASEFPDEIPIEIPDYLSIFQ